eukprot:330810-Pleurochrysis_carterae.AAC.3
MEFSMSERAACGIEDTAGPLLGSEWLEGTPGSYVGIRGKSLDRSYQAARDERESFPWRRLSGWDVARRH